MRKFLIKIFRLIVFLLVLPWLYAFCLNFINPPITITQVNSMIEGYGLNRNYLSSNEIPQNAKWAVIAAEDQGFATHAGFDLNEIEKVYKKNQEGKKLRGASTISQQLAKNVFLWQQRSWIRKGLEVYCTFVLETVLSKNRILEVYLNSVEMGKGTFGLGAAAEYYFDKPASELNLDEICRIIAALPSPKKYNVNPASSYIQQRSRWIQRQIKNLKGDATIQEVIAPIK